MGRILREHMLHAPTRSAYEDAVQTRESFDYQWRKLPTGRNLPSDEAFMESAPELICSLTDLPRGWFPGKRVLDLGAGMGRFSHGLLRLGALVTASDQSAGGLKQAAALCSEWSDSLTLLQRDILDWSDEEAFDLVFCFGVVHHTGNTYLAIRNAAIKVRLGGRLFLMVYGLPRTVEDMKALNNYEALREELYELSLEERAQELLRRFGPDLAHAYFDAVSPQINDLLSFHEIRQLLHRLGFENVRLTVDSRNHHLVADRRRSTSFAMESPS